MRLSIIIPTLNEGAIISTLLTAISGLRSAGHEIIVADGGSSDNTVIAAQPLADKVITAETGRARQMNTGARAACGDVLVFLHADSFLPSNANDLIISGIKKSGKSWGKFDVQLSGGYLILRIVEIMMNWRSRLSGIATGDQCLFICRELFDAVGGFPDLALMEDIAISSLLKQREYPLCIREKVITSSRRWERQGFMRTILLMWRLRLGFLLGEDTQRLAQVYQQK